MAETSYSSWDPIRATRQNQDIQREVEDTAMMDIQVSRQQCTGYRGRDTVCCRATWWAGGEANPLRVQPLMFKLIASEDLF